MARFVKHTSCENCGSRDNVGIYDDGSTFCFGCHHYTLPSGYDRLRKYAAVHEYMKTEPIDRFGNDVVELPSDFTLSIPTEPYRWVSKYITPMEMLDHCVGWSAEEGRLIFPIYDRPGNVLMWVGRAAEGVKPKWYIHGKKNEVLHVIEGNPASDALVVVEDIVSAIKVSRITNTLPIFGTHFPLERARKLSERFSEVRLWYDCDAKEKALKTALKLSHWFRKVKVVFSEEDPKVYGTSEIGNFLK